MTAADRRMEIVSILWSVDILHQDHCRVEDKNVQQNLNMFRKMVINLIKNIKKGLHPNVLFQKSCLIVCLTLPIFVKFLEIDFRGSMFCDLEKFISQDFGQV